MLKIRSFWIIALVTMILAACSSGGAGTPTASPAASTQAITATAVATVTVAAPNNTASPTAQSTATLDANASQNPVLDQDFPDPDALNVGGTWYAYSTNSNNLNIQVASSTDLAHWTLQRRDALPSLPGWARPSFGYAWAPDVSAAADGKGLIMFFTARYKIGADGTQCIGAATAEKPEGPFKPAGDAPVVCQVEQGGSIDPATFEQDGKRYLLWKNDGNSQGGFTWIYIQPLAADGLTLTGEPVQLIKADQAWEGVLIEGPTLWKQGDTYYLFYSANDYASQKYAVGYATASDVLGPYTKEPGPLLKTSIPNGIVGPGGQDVVALPDGSTWLLFHAWTSGAYRAMNLARLEWQDGKPVVTALEKGAHPLPQK